MKPITEKVEKWVARDGSLHDSEQDAERYMLRCELAQAIKAGLDGPTKDAAGNVLYHFDVWRKVDAPPARFTPTPVKPARRFPWGVFWGATLATAYMMWVFY